MCVNNLTKVALDSPAAGIEPAISSRKSNALTTAPPITSFKFDNGREPATQSRLNVGYLQHGDSNYCRQNDASVHTFIYKLYISFGLHLST